MLDKETPTINSPSIQWTCLIMTILLILATGHADVSPTPLHWMVGINVLSTLLTILGLFMTVSRELMLYNMKVIGTFRSILNSVLHYSAFVIWISALYLITNVNSSKTMISCGVILGMVNIVRIFYSIPLIIASRKFNVEAFKADLRQRVKKA
jgi:hypothetical protein